MSNVILPKLSITHFKVCYPDLACFTLEGAFKHHASLPQSPEVIKVNVRLNTRVSGPEVEKTEALNWRDPQSLVDSTYDPKKPTFIFVHGYLGYVDKDWLIELMQVGGIGQGH